MLIAHQPFCDQALPVSTRCNVTSSLFKPIAVILEGWSRLIHFLLSPSLGRQLLHFKTLKQISPLAPTLIGSSEKIKEVFPAQV